MLRRDKKVAVLAPGRRRPRLLRRFILSDSSLDARAGRSRSGVIGISLAEIAVLTLVL